MNTITRFLPLTLGLALLSSCTGDPTKGGIFWSPAKAQERQNQLVQTATVLQTETDKATARNQQLKKDLATSQAQLAKIRAEINAISASSHPEEYAALQAKAARLEQEVANQQALLLQD